MRWICILLPMLQQNEIDIYSIKTPDKTSRYMNLPVIQINAYYW